MVVLKLPVKGTAGNGASLVRCVTGAACSQADGAMLSRGRASALALGVGTWPQRAQTSCNIG
jgi:hypothetical protein